MLAEPSGEHGLRPVTIQMDTPAMQRLHMPGQFSVDGPPGCTPFIRRATIPCPHQTRIAHMHIRCVNPGSPRTTEYPYATIRHAPSPPSTANPPAGPRRTCGYPPASAPHPSTMPDSVHVACALGTGHDRIRSDTRRPPGHSIVNTACTNPTHPHTTGIRRTTR